MKKVYRITRHLSVGVSVIIFVMVASLYPEVITNWRSVLLSALVSALIGTGVVHLFEFAHGPALLIKDDK